MNNECAWPNLALTRETSCAHRNLDESTAYVRFLGDTVTGC